MTTLAVRPDSEVAPTAGLHVVFKVGGADYAIDTASVLQMESFTSATPVPGAKPFVAGVVPIRGRVVPVIDLRVRFGLPPAAPTLDARLVVVCIADRAVALLADSAREVIHLQASDVTRPPAVLEGGSRRFVRGIAQTGDRIVLLLDVAQVVGEESVQ